MQCGSRSCRMGLGGMVATPGKASLLSSLSFWWVVGGWEAVGMSYCVVTDGLESGQQQRDGGRSLSHPEAVATQPFILHSNHSSSTLNHPLFVKNFSSWHKSVLSLSAVC